MHAIEREISEEFLSLGDYKDAKILALKSYNKIKTCRRNLRLTATFVISLIFTLISGIGAVFFIALPVFYVFTLIYIK